MDINEFLSQFGLQVATNDEAPDFDERFHMGIGDYCRGEYHAHNDSVRRKGYETACQAAKLIVRLRKGALIAEKQTSFFP